VGKYSTTSAQASCSPCGEGRSQSRVRQTKCDGCDVGKYQDGSSPAFCLACPPGKLSSMANATACSACKAGGYSGVGSSECVACEAGKAQASAGQGSCDKCEGTSEEYQDREGSTACKTCASCPAGSRQGCGASAEGYCTDCSPGRFSNTLGCFDCPDGYFQSETNALNCTRCGGCASGKRGSCKQSFEGVCTPCLPGTYADPIADTCASCPEAYFQPDLNALECVACPGGKFQKHRGKTFCQEVKLGFTVFSKEDPSTGEVVYEELECPLFGVHCDGSLREYTGHMWHDPAVDIPNCTITDSPTTDPPVCTSM
jgi:hypothetical protein